MCALPSRGKCISLSPFLSIVPFVSVYINLYLHSHFISSRNHAPSLNQIPASLRSPVIRIDPGVSFLVYSKNPTHAGGGVIARAWGGGGRCPYIVPGGPSFIRSEAKQHRGLEVREAAVVPGGASREAVVMVWDQAEPG